MNGFTDRRILFIGIGFYDYEASIVERLRRRGAFVQAFLDRPAVLRRGMLAPALRRAGIKGLPLIERHERRILRAAQHVPYDFVLIIKCIDVRTDFLEALRRQQARATFILYQWDSLARMPGIEERISYFDRLLTFDRGDAAEHPRFRFRPLFYRENIPAAQSAAQRVDLCFVGWMHSDRLEIIRRIQAIAQAQQVSFSVYLYTGLYTTLKLALAGNSRDVHFKPLPYAALLEMNRRAAVILDLPHAEQTGMTMRAIEAVGLGKKLITTARDVVNYDFFSHENVQVLRADDLQLNRAFICGPASAVPDHVRRRYSLDSWLDDVFGLASA